MSAVEFTSEFLSRKCVPSTKEEANALIDDCQSYLDLMLDDTPHNMRELLQQPSFKSIRKSWFRVLDRKEKEPITNVQVVAVDEKPKEKESEQFVSEPKRWLTPVDRIMETLETLIMDDTEATGTMATYSFVPENKQQVDDIEKKLTERFGESHGLWDSTILRLTGIHQKSKSKLIRSVRSLVAIDAPVAFTIDGNDTREFVCVIVVSKAARIRLMRYKEQQNNLPTTD